jgi:hypothetical protein
MFLCMSKQNQHSSDSSKNCHPAGDCFHPDTSSLNYLAAALFFETERAQQAAAAA